MPTSHNPAAAAAAGTALLFEHYQNTLRRRVRALVSTSEANVEDACMYAWAQFLSHELDDTDTAHSWLTTVAMREAVKLDRRSRRELALIENVPDDELAQLADPRDELRMRELLADVGAVIKAAGLSDRQARILGLQILGYRYDEIAEQTGDSHRTIERQIVTARKRLARALGRRGG